MLTIAEEDRSRDMPRGHSKWKGRHSARPTELPPVEGGADWLHHMLFSFWFGLLTFYVEIHIVEQRAPPPPPLVAAPNGAQQPSCNRLHFLSAD